MSRCPTLSDGPIRFACSRRRASRGSLKSDPAQCSPACFAISTRRCWESNSEKRTIGRNCMRLWRKSVLTAASALLLVGCKMPGEKQDFGALEDEFVYGSLALSPVSATSAGYHVHQGKRLDEMLDDFSPSGIAEQRRFR